MSVIRVKGMGFAQIQREFEPLLEAMISTDPASGRRVLTADAIRELLNRCDDVDRAHEPMAQAVFRFLLARDAQIELADS